MATADQYAAWIVQNASKRGTPDFDTVVRAYELAKREETPSVPIPTQAPGIGEKILGAGEAALNLATGATGGALGMIGGTAKGITEQILSGQFGTPQAVKLVEKAATEGAQALTYQPRTESGQQIAGAIGEALTNVIPVVPLAAEMGALAQGARQAAPLAQATAQRGVQAVSDTGAGAVQSVRSLVGQTPETMAVGNKAAAGAAATPEALQRVTTAQSLPVPINLTRGAATRDAAQLAFEKEQMKGEFGAPLRSRTEENNLQALQNFDAMVDMSGARTPDLVSTGNSVVDALSKGYGAARTRTNVLYNKAKQSPESKMTVDIALPVAIGEGENAINASLIEYLNGKVRGLPSTTVPDTARALMVKLGVAAEDESGNLIPKRATVGQLEDIRKELSGTAKWDDRVGLREESIIKKIIDQQTEPVAGPLYKAAREARTEQARTFENRAVVARLLETVRNMDDPRVAADQVFQKTILGSSPEEIQFIRRVLKSNGDTGKQAWADLQGATLRYLQEESSKGVGMDSSGRPLISPAKLNQLVNQLDKNGRLEAIFDKQQAQTIRDINEVVRYVNTVPPGTLVNTSGTAGTLMAALAEAGGLGAMTGIPIPVISGIRQIKKMIDEKKTKERINAALNALPEKQ